MRPFSPLVLLALAFAPALPPPTADRFEEEARRLGPDNDKETRRAAVRWLDKHCREPEAVRAVPALERCLKNDPDAEVRGAAVQSLAMIAHHRKQSCPLAVVEALLDRDADVRNLAAGSAGLFKAFPAGALPLLLRCMKSEHSEDRASTVSLLALAGGKDEKTLLAIREVTRDKHFLVRHNAQIALFSVTDNLEDALRKQNVEAVLKRLRDGDPDRAVRDAAAEALRAFEAAPVP